MVIMATSTPPRRRGVFLVFLLFVVCMAGVAMYIMPYQDTGKSTETMGGGGRAKVIEDQNLNWHVETKHAGVVRVK